AIPRDNRTMVPDADLESTSAGEVPGARARGSAGPGARGRFWEGERMPRAPASDSPPGRDPGASVGRPLGAAARGGGLSGGPVAYASVRAVGAAICEPRLGGGPRQLLSS